MTKFLSEFVRQRRVRLGKRQCDLQLGTSALTVIENNPSLSFLTLEKIQSLAVDLQVPVSMLFELATGEEKTFRDKARSWVEKASVASLAQFLAEATENADAPVEAGQKVRFRRRKAKDDTPEVDASSGHDTRLY